MAKLHFYFSAMNAGKTTTLLQSSYNYNERGMDTILFAPAIDDRYAAGTIASRIGLTASAVAFDEHFNFLAHVANAVQVNRNIRCILVDEAQFLKKRKLNNSLRLRRAYIFPCSLMDCALILWANRSRAANIY